MQIDDHLISRLEKLAKLQLSENERNHFKGDLNKILQMVAKLQELDLDGLDPLVYMNEGQNRLRTDEVKDQLSRAQALKNAPQQDGEHFEVPRVIK